MSHSGDYAVVLGRIPELSVREIEATLARSNRQRCSINVTSGVALVKATPNPDTTWFHRLGGSTKFGVVLTELMADIDALLRAVRLHLGPRSRLGIGTRGLPHSLARKLGIALKRAGLTRRFVTGDRNGDLSAAQSKQFRQNRDAELLLLPSASGWWLIHITAAQRIDQFTVRDRGAPQVHGKRGMLPTKLARTMVNIGLGLVSSKTVPRLLDPCCGTGRVLMEATLVGATVFGSDIDPTAVTATIDNLTWLDEYSGHPKRTWQSAIAVADLAWPATNPHSVSVIDLYPPASIDVIVTEPDLGPPQVSTVPLAQAKQILSRLLPTYTALLESGSKLLKPDGGMVVVLPVMSNQAIQPNLIDTIYRLGYHIEDSIRVARPDQFVSRDIVILSRK
ncbi:hypothetical protein HY524_00460 [Candidatus Berkelbacteria bacterium]|nr:hypothetical protein [Candidatus Berkelbacteria bacterium]